MMRAVIAAMLLMGGCDSDAYDRDVDIIAFGDSNTEQVSLNESDRWVSRVAASHPDLLVINAGRGGNTTAAGLARFDGDVQAHSPGIVLIMLGTNDAVMLSDDAPQVSHEQFAVNMEFFVSQIVAWGGTPVLITTIPIIEGDEGAYYYSRHTEDWYLDGGARAWHDSYNSITRNIASKHNMPLIDAWQSFIDVAGEESDAALIASGLLDESGTHMSSVGAERIASMVNAAIDDMGNRQ